MLLALALLSACASAGPQGSRVVLVTIDGTRWQEIFRGADATLSAGLPPELVRGEAAERRQALLPFLWKTVAAEGQIFGNPERGSRMVVANPWRGSYPGYHELLCGSVSPVIVSNKRIPNPDPTVLHWLERRPGFGGAVAAFASWDVFASILNQGQGGVLVDVGPAPAASAEIDRLAREAPPPWADSVYDAFVFRRALRHLQAREPRVLFVGLGDTDEWAHARRYDRYLQALRRTDGWLAELWGELQARPAYRGRTSLVITVDHGRGDGPEGWQTHGADVPGSEVVWAAVLGPGVPARGERAGAAPLTLGQVAATVVRLAGEEPGAFPGAAPVLPLWAAP